MKPEDFAGAGPAFVLEDYFAGRTRAWGLFEDRFGNVKRQFVVDIVGTWDGTYLTLEEDFVYSDGETDRRVWRIRKLDDHHYEGTAADVVGTAQGVRYGNALSWRYQLDLAVKGRTWRVTFDDWMFLQPDGIVINRARVRKWGLDVGEVTLAFRKEDAPAAGAAAAGQPAAAASEQQPLPVAE